MNTIQGQIYKNILNYFCIRNYYKTKRQKQMVYFFELPQLI